MYTRPCETITHYRKRFLHAPWGDLLLAFYPLICLLLPYISRILYKWGHFCRSRFLSGAFHSSYSSSSFLFHGWIAFHCMTILQFVCMLICWLFPLGVIIKNTSMVVHLQMFCEHVLHFSWGGTCVAVELLGHKTNV